MVTILSEDVAGEGDQRNTGMRVLVAFEDDYRAYREVIAAGLRILHDQYEVTTSTLGELEEVKERFRPDVVICGGPEDAEAASVSCWIELNIDPTEPTKVRLGECHWELPNPQLEALVGIIEKADHARGVQSIPSPSTWPRPPMPKCHDLPPSSSVPSPHRT